LLFTVVVNVAITGSHSLADKSVLIGWFDQSLLCKYYGTKTSVFWVLL